MNKPLIFPNLTIIIRCVFQEGGKLYPQIYLDERFYELLMLEYDRIDISEEIDLKKQTHQKSAKFVIIGNLKILLLNMNHIFVMVVMV